MTHTLRANIGIDKFPIIIGKNISQELLAFLDTYNPKNIFLIIDSYFKNENGTVLIDLNLTNKFSHLFINGGIESKNLQTYELILIKLFEKNIARDGLIVSIGGGVIGDISAFVASTFQRGIDFIHIPTTTTAMIDSSVGGKTGLNFLDQVNLIGTYFNPKAIFMDLRFLTSLKIRDYYAGLCEAIKMSLTSDKDMFYKFFEIVESVQTRDLEILEDIIYWSVITKLNHVSCDFKEQSIRLKLNYGHTFGQSIETYYGLYQDKLKHGEAVALGIMVAANLSNLLFNNKDSKNLLNKTFELLDYYKLPNKFSKLKTNDFPDLEKLVKNISNDKKRLSIGSRFVICESIGQASIKLINDSNLIQNSFSCLFH